MKNKILSLLSLLCLPALLSLTGCATTGSNSAFVAAVKDPNNEAKAAKLLVGGVANRVLAKNPSYAADFSAVADALVAVAQSSTTTLTSADVQTITAKTSLDASTQGEIVADFSFLQGELLSAFPVTLPTFKPIYQLWLLSIANGLYLATGHAQVPVPTVAPVSTPAPIPAASTTSAFPLYALKPEA